MYMHLKKGLEKLKQSLFICSFKNVKSEDWDQEAEIQAPQKTGLSVFQSFWHLKVTSLIFGILNW